MKLTQTLNNKSLYWLINLFIVMSLASCVFLSNNGAESIQSKTLPNTPTIPSSITNQVPPVSVQLWSVKNELKADFEGTIKHLANMGFNGVEFAGDFGPYKNKPKQLKAFLSQHGLSASGAHVGFEKLSEDNIQATLTFYQTLDVKFVIVPWDERAWHPTGVIELAEQLTTLSEQLKPYGLVIGFHNHDLEFNDYEGSTYWDYIAQHTPESVILQLDVGWVNYAGKDPIAYVKKYAGRTLTTHYKIRTKADDNVTPIIGQDNYNWAELIKTNMEVGGTKWLVVEQEEYPEGLLPIEAVAQSKLGLDKLIEQLK